MTIVEMVSEKEGRIFPCVTLLLYWLIGSDGSVDDVEIGLLKSFTPADEDYSIGDYQSLLKNDFIQSVYDACRILSRSLDSEGGSRLVELMIGIMIADNRASFPELHIIRFISDLFCINRNQLDGIYVKIAGKPFPEPGDVSSRSWWQGRERKHYEHGQDGYNNRKNMDIPQVDERKEWALKVLGLTSDCDHTSIKQAYRRMCNQHHPDRFEQLGPEATAAANIIFKKINEAYEVLTAS
jgi:DnaJ-domain-containing protein 1